MKHTPGPWRIEPVLCNGNPNNTHMVCGGRTGTPAEQCYIADCRVSSYYRTKEETDANAHLIAAAPEMLDALNDLANLPADDEGNRTIPAGMLDAARAAIAKAEGIREPNAPKAFTPTPITFTTEDVAEMVSRFREDYEGDPDYDLDELPTTPEELDGILTDCEESICIFANETILDAIENRARKGQ